MSQIDSVVRMNIYPKFNVIQYDENDFTVGSLYKLEGRLLAIHLLITLLEDIWEW